MLTTTDTVGECVGVFPPDGETDRMAVGFIIDGGAYVQIAISRENAIKLAADINRYAGTAA